MALRLVSSELYNIVTSIISTDRRRLLRHFVSEVDVLLGYIRKNNVIIGGEASLAFILRDPSLFPDSLELYVDAKVRLYGAGNDLAEETRLRLELVEHDDNTESPHTDYAIRTGTYRTQNGRVIKLFLPVDINTLLEPIVSPWSTALINFVGADTFGCGYPLLTFRRRALSHPINHLEEGEKTVRSRLISNGFEHNTTPTAWGDYLSFSSQSDIPRVSHKPWGRPCMRELYVCPGQGRYFGDEGSLVATFDPLHIDFSALRKSRTPPYGPTVAWRLDVESERCDGPCVDEDPILPEGAYMITAILVGNGCPLRSTFKGMEML